MFAKLAVIFLIIASIFSVPIFAVSSNDTISFDESTNPNFILKGTQTITNEDNPSYQLNGIGDYLILNSKLPEKMTDLSLSVWVKPDYRIGAPATLSIISQSNAFILSINNDQITDNFATFSVYDGIKWHHVTSKSAIKNTWTHLAAEFSDNTISIFVNGVKENSTKVDGSYSFTYTHGVAKQNSLDYLMSKSKILVGAFSPLLREDGVVKNNFSGFIDDVTLYNTRLSEDQILKLYENNRTYKQLIIQNTEVFSKKTGTPNQFGFTIDPDNLNDQKIETLSSNGYKIKKSSSGTNNINTEKEETSSNQPTNTNNQNVEILKDAGQSSEILKPKVGSGSTTTICHNPSGIIDDAITITVFPSSVNIHLDHGDTLGECFK